MLAAIEEIYAHFCASNGLCTDTRLLQPGQIFLALVGDQFDGNEFALSALDQGANYAVVSSRRLAEANDRCIYQPNTLTCLHRLAAQHRAHFRGKVIGITGSNGKTTSKELIVSVLSQKFKVKGTRGNLNNHIGVPLTILSLTDEDEIAVVEMGANHPGEIKLLCNIADPEYGYITNVGQAHLEGFGSLEVIRETKFALYHHIANRAGGGCFYLNGDEKSLSEFISSSHPRVFTFTAQKYSNIEVVPTVSFDWSRGDKKHRVTSELYGQHNFTNVTAAISIAEDFGLSSDEIVRGITAYVPGANRSQLMQWGNHRVYLDAYNANPSSMAEALIFFKRVQAKRKVLILGDMLEIGAQVGEMHEKILVQAQDMDLTQVILVGEIFATLASRFQHSEWTFTTSLAEARKIALDMPSSTLYLKGSRSIGLEKIISPLGGSSHTDLSEPVGQD